MAKEVNATGIIRLNSFFLDEFYPLFEEFLTNDVSELKELSDFFLKGEYTKERVSNALDYYKIAIFGYFNEGKLVGFIWGSASYAGLGFVSWLWVRKENRNHQIASKLLLFYENYIKEAQGHVIELYCFDSMQKFYLKQGYKLIGRREKGYFQIPQCIMNKFI